MRTELVVQTKYFSENHYNILRKVFKNPGYRIPNSWDDEFISGAE